MSLLAAIALALGLYALLSVFALATIRLLESWLEAIDG